MQKITRIAILERRVGVMTYMGKEAKRRKKRKKEACQKAIGINLKELLMAKQKISVSSKINNDSTGL